MTFLLIWILLLITDQVPREPSILHYVTLEHLNNFKKICLSMYFSKNACMRSLNTSQKRSVSIFSPFVSGIKFSTNRSKKFYQMNILKFLCLPEFYLSMDPLPLILLLDLLSTSMLRQSSIVIGTTSNSA